MVNLMMNDYFALLGLSIFHFGGINIPNLRLGNLLRIFAHFVTSFITDISLMLLAMDLRQVPYRKRENKMEEIEETEETETIPHVVFEEILEEVEDLPLSVVLKRMKMAQKVMDVI